MSYKNNLFEELKEELNKQFPKGKCKERGNALILFSIFKLKFYNFIKGVLDEIERRRKDYKKYDDELKELKQLIKQKAGDELI